MIPVAVLTKTYRFLICCSLAAILIPVTDGIGDKIILKDGTIEQSDRIWETEQYVHFILKGTQGVEIRYSKEIVSRIEYQQPAGKVSLQKTPPPVGKTKINVGGAINNGSNQEARSVDQTPEASKNQGHNDYERLVSENRGLLFYDPRRPMRYWATRNSKHKALTVALDALSEKYGRPAGWVETHMGQENDLGKIHENLTRQRLHEATGSGETKSGKTAQISSEPTSKEDVKEARHGSMPVRKKFTLPQIAKGIRFYDPRRDEKYWSGQMTRHHTLKEALNALARQYGVTPSWIENHMGDTNDLAAIHLNLQKNLKQR